MKNAYTRNRFGLKSAARQRGASLLEGIAYLGIAALVVLGAVSLLSSAFSSSDSNRTMEEISAIRTGVKRMFTGMANSYGNSAGGTLTNGDITPTLISAGIFPTTLNTNATGGTVTNTWNGAVKVTGNGQTFVIEYDAVPKAVCVSTLSGTIGWTSVSTGGTAVTSFPVSPKDADTLCAGDTNSIQLTSE